MKIPSFFSFFKLKNIQAKLLSFSVFAAKVLVVWFLFNLAYQLYAYLFTEAGRTALTQSDQNTQMGYIFSLVSGVVLNGVQAAVFFGYSQIVTWIIMLKKGESVETKKDNEKNLNIERSNDSTKQVSGNTERKKEKKRR